MIEKHETKYGPLPASVREWYLVPNVVSLDPRYSAKDGPHWAYDDDPPRSLPEVLDEFALANRARDRDVWFMDGHQQECRYFIRLNGRSNPPVFNDYGRRAKRDWRQQAPTFSDFVMECFAHRVEWALRWGRSAASEDLSRPYANGLWLRTPDEPFQPPIIDFLTDQFGEPERTPRPGDVTTYTFRPQCGVIRVTADHPALTGGLSAWWVHAETPGRLAEFARLLLPWGTLRETLRADTDPAREVLKHA